MAMFSPRLLLRSQDRLDLSDAQVEQLTNLQTEAATASSQARAALATHRAQMREALTADAPDANAVRQHLEASQEARTQLEWIGVDTMLRSRAVLTEDQRSLVRDMVAEHSPRRGRMQRGRRH
jgi:Spy/CpxP family protein refolding chaperone